MKKISVGISDFKEIITNNIFYIDKTYFLKEWIDNADFVTLIIRPRRFGKTLTMSMVEYFLSDKHKDDRYLFDNLYINNCADSHQYMQLQGNSPVIFLSFAGIKGENLTDTIREIESRIANIYEKYRYIYNSDLLSNEEKMYYTRIVSQNGDNVDLARAIHNLSEFIERYTNNKVYILLDEYDTPLQNAYVKGYWNELTSFIISFFVNTFKNNTSLKKALITGITRVSKESIFSDFNNLKVISTTSNSYASCFGFTESETFSALDNYGLSSEKDKVKQYYNGFIMGGIDIYNPWSILHFLSEKKYANYWVNTSSNNIINDVITGSSTSIKIDMEDLLKGNTIQVSLNEDVVYKDLDDAPDSAIWGLLLASGYVKVLNYDEENSIYSLQLTNLEVHKMFAKLFKQWFSKSLNNYNNFISTMLTGDAEGMEYFLNTLSVDMFSYFDTSSNNSSKLQPEKFYHGFILSLMVDMKDRFIVDSNRESGYGRYDVCVIPHDINKDVGVIIEFKVYYGYESKSLEDVALEALEQIENKKYEQRLLSMGVKKIYKYGIAFKGKYCKISCKNT